MREQLLGVLEQFTTLRFNWDETPKHVLMETIDETVNRTLRINKRLHKELYEIVSAYDEQFGQDKTDSLLDSLIYKTSETIKN